MSNLSDLLRWIFSLLTTLRWCGGGIWGISQYIPTVLILLVSINRSIKPKLSSAIVLLEWMIRETLKTQGEMIYWESGICYIFYINLLVHSLIPSQHDYYCYLHFKDQAHWLQRALVSYTRSLWGLALFEHRPDSKIYAQVTAHVFCF